LLAAIGKKDVFLQKKRLSQAPDDKGLITTCSTRETSASEIFLAANAVPPRLCLVLGGTAAFRLPIGAGRPHFFYPERAMQDAGFSRNQDLTF
jgi:hypothetical protein